MNTPTAPLRSPRALARAAGALLLFSLAALWVAPAAAEVPDTLQYAIPAPPVGTLTEPHLSQSVAVDGSYTIVGVPLDDSSGTDSGVVKVFDSSTGALRFLLPNPGPEASDWFGWTVGISGTRVVVGAYGDNTGATDAGSAYIYDLASGTPTVPVTTLNHPAAGELFGYAVAISGARVVVGAVYSATGATNAGSAYVYDLNSGTPTVPVVTLNNPSPAVSDNFGGSVGISGTWVVIGSNGDDGGRTDGGSAFVYDLSRSTPAVPVATLYKPGVAVEDEFGYPVAISGTRMVVGARFDDTGAYNAGSAYVYDLSSGYPALVATLHNPTPGASDYFGQSVAISGSRVVAGTPYDTTAGTYAGSAYVYDLNGDTPTVPVVTLNNPQAPASDVFGWSVAISGTRLVVGARLNDPGVTGAGGAYIYELSGGTPTAPVAALSSPTPTAGDNFGIAVALSGTRMVVGAQHDDTGATDAGSAYVYDLTSATPTAPAVTLHNPDPAAGDEFGYPVAISATRVVVGARLDDTGANDAGSAYVYDLSSATPTVPVATLRNPTPAAGDYFGYSAATDGTLVVVGAIGENSTGGAYVYDLSSATPTVPVATLPNPDPAAGDYFGYSVAISGTRVVVGAVFDDTGATNSGSAYVYDLSSATPTAPVVTLNNPAQVPGDIFGRSVAISGARVVVGVALSDTGATDAGIAYAYDLNSATPSVPVVTLNNPVPVVSDTFGTSVAISGTWVVVGSNVDYPGAGDAGSAYIYDLNSATPSVPVATLHNPGPAAGDWFGFAVAIDGTTVAIGTPNDDSVVPDKGFAYVFAPLPNIAVEQPVGTVLADGSGSLALGQVLMGSSSAGVTLTVRNTGSGALVLGAISVDGENAGDFTVDTAGMLMSLPAGGSTTFNVTFTPAALGRRSAALHIASNVTGWKNPYDLTLTGTGYDPASPGNPDAMDAGISGQVFATAVQPDGKIIIAGWFTSVLGVPRQYIARLNADGTLDMGFDPCPSGPVFAVAVQADGKVLLGGDFYSLQPNGAATPTTRQYLARVNADGTLDTGFDPRPDSRVNGLAVQADGKVLLGGYFNTLRPNGAATPTTRQYLARVNTNGTLDSGFDPKPNGPVYSMWVQAYGKVLLGGDFTTLQPNGAATATPRRYIARVNADGTLDTGFDPGAISEVYCMAVQPDGKVLLGGSFFSIPNFIGRLFLARVNADGTLDAGFDPKPNGHVYGVALQADGKILLGGDFTTLQPNGAATATPRRYIARVNADGTLDTGFDPMPNSIVYSVAVQADGKILLAGGFTTLQPNGATPAITRAGFARLLNDPAMQTLSVPDSTQLLWTRGGAGPELSRATFEQSTDGGVNWTLLGPGTRVGITANWQITGLTLPAGGQLRARGVTTGGGYFNGSSGLVESGASFGIVPAPTVTGISPSSGPTAGGTRVTITGTDLTSASLVTLGGTAATAVTVVNATTITATTPAHAEGVVDVAVTTPRGTGTGPAIFTYNGPNTPGNLDALDAGISSGRVVYATAVQPDGKMIIAGYFTSVLGVPRQNIARLNADGTLDMGFDPRPNSTVYCVGVQADGKVLLGGQFIALQPNGAAAPTTRYRIARVNADGTLDPGFDVTANGSVYSVAVQADGKVLLGGGFTTLEPAAIGPTARRYIARVNADGTLDAGFDPAANSYVFGMAVQADGKVLLGGHFTTLQPNGAVAATARQYIARVNANGTLDTGFNPKPNSPVYSMASQADGRVLLGGYFTTLQPNGATAATARQYIARVNADGTLDTGFNPMPNNVVYGLAVQADGKVLLGGYFNYLQPNGAATATARQYIARVNADGTLDAGFDPRPNGQVYSVALQADGKVLLGGQFTTLQPNNAGAPTARSGFARLINDPAVQSLIAPDTRQALWQRGGAAPELSRVTFDLSTDEGVTWTPLGPGSRVGPTPNWLIAGLQLPAAGQLRARGVSSSGGVYGSSSGLVEQVAVLSYPAVTDNDGLLDSWELAYWPTTAGHGPHDDDDLDGYDNLLELAFNLNPLRADAGILPLITNEGGYLTMTITKQPGVFYEVQTAPTPLSGAFSAAGTTVLLDDATTLKVRDNVPRATGPRRFMRAMVTGDP